MAKHGKKYRAAAEKVDNDTFYTPSDAIDLAMATSTTSFDSTIEVHIRTGLDPRKADQQVRDTVNLPNGLGKKVRVLVFAEGEGATIAREAGADYVADDDEMMKKIQDGWTDFDIAIATPQMMGKAGRLGRVLGPRGLMPNPKAGTVVQAEDLPKAIEESKAGKVEYRLDKTANMHVPIGKASFGNEKLMENFTALMRAVVKARPAVAKVYIERVTLASTMGPGVKVDVYQAQNL
ncbi:MAG TPA: 50S ribosomal protein L1 [Anaerolineales bacterium]|nr:50S ribosomal protein L1 [Anaerolineales bacterium]